MSRKRLLIFLGASLALSPVRAEFKPATPEEAFAGAQKLLQARRKLNEDLLKAVERGNTGLAQLLLDEGASPNAKDSAGLTPLMLAVKNGDPSTIRLLLRKAADVNLRTQAGTALELAIDSGRIASLYRLITVKNLDVNGSRGCVTPLIRAIQAARHDMVSVLVDKGASAKPAAPGCKDALSLLREERRDGRYRSTPDTDFDLMEMSLRNAGKAQATGKVK